MDNRRKNPTIKKRTVGTATIEVWRSTHVHFATYPLVYSLMEDTYYAQDVLCRGIIGIGDSQADAIIDLWEALGGPNWDLALQLEQFRQEIESAPTFDGPSF